ncbi:MAG: hypothetical protein ACI9LV_000765 [Candidatus Nanohaloarchaea archaeon]
MKLQPKQSINGVADRMKEEVEVYYFEPDEFENPANLKDVLEGLGEETDLRYPLRNEIRIFAEQINRDWSNGEILDEESYVLDGNISAEYLETEEGVFVASESHFLSEETRALESRYDSRVPEK